MSFERFLQFWSVYNRQIIEFVFVSTFVLILIVIYRQFFAKSESVIKGDGHVPVSIDTSEIEEKLKKILENQGTVRSMPPVASNETVEAASVTSKVEHVASAVPMDTHELDKLKNEIKERDKAIEELKKTAAAAPAGVTVDTKKFEDKIKELEGRLQEYEIISEDIADLSFYKEENARLQKELSATGSQVAAAPTSAPVPSAVVMAPSAVIETPVSTVTPPVTEPSQIETAAAAAVETETQVVSASPPVSESTPVSTNEAVVDDDILKEFAAAVEGQKNAETKTTVSSSGAIASTSAVEEPSKLVSEPQAVDPQKLVESKELMGEFENFIKKG